MDTRAWCCFMVLWGLTLDLVEPLPVHVLDPFALPFLRDLWVLRASRVEREGFPELSPALEGMSAVLDSRMSNGSHAS